MSTSCTMITLTSARVYRFWEIAIPIMIVVVPLFLWPDLKRYGQNIHGHFIQRRLKKVGETSHFGTMSTTLTTCVDRALRLGHDTNQSFVSFTVVLAISLDIVVIIRVVYARLSCRFRSSVAVVHCTHVAGAMLSMRVREFPRSQ